MTFSRIQATGRGRLRARAVIEGFPDELVSAADMARSRGTTTTGRISGLDVKSIRFGARGDLMRAKIEAESCDISISGSAATTLLGMRPQRLTYLSVTLAVGDTTATVFDTSDWPSSGVFHVGTEAISYSGKTATTFTGLARGIWGTTAQAHYAADGTGLSYPRVTEVPESLEGRRVVIYFYGEGDAASGDGTLVHRGIATTGVRFAKGVWSFTLDPITRILDGRFGAQYGQPIGIRGIFYPPTAPLLLVLTNVTSTATAVVKFTGFYETDEAFAAALTTAIANAIASPVSGSWSWSSGSSIIAQHVPAVGWQLVYTVGSGAGSPASVSLAGSVSYVDEMIPHATPTWFKADGSTGGRLVYEGTVPAAGDVWIMARTSPTPRGAVGAFPTSDAQPYVDAYARWFSIAPSDATADPHHVYYAGGLVPTTDHVALIYAADPTDDAPHNTATVEAVNTSSGYLSVFSVLLRLSPRTRIKLGTNIVTGTVEDFRQALIAASPTLSGIGGMPLITAADILALDLSDLVASSDIPLASNRVFVGLADLTVGEVVENELVALGCYQRLNNGAIEWLRLRAGTSTDTATWTIDEGDVIGWPGFERGKNGIVSTVTYKTGWNPAENDWQGGPVTFHDVEAASSNRAAIDIEVAQRSYPAGREEGVLVDALATVENVAKIAVPLLSLFGTEYDSIQVEVGMRYFGVKFGDVVSLTSSKVPSFAGTLGVSGELCVVVGHSFDASTGRIAIELLRSGQPVAGYAPGFRITGQSNISGNTWDLTVDLASYTDESTIARWYSPGDAVRVMQGDSTTPTEVLGAVASITSATVVRVTFVGVWTPGASEWCVRPQSATVQDSSTGLGRFFYVANASLKIAYASGAITARVLSA